MHLVNHGVLHLMLFSLLFNIYMPIAIYLILQRSFIHNELQSFKFHLELGLKYKYPMDSSSFYQYHSVLHTITFGNQYSYVWKLC
jgi:hypothetical protein